MNKEQLSKYTVRTTQANKSELVVVVYDIILDEMTNAKMSFEQGDMDGFMYSVRHGQKFVLELMNTLDVKYDISKELMRYQSRNDKFYDKERCFFVRWRCYGSRKTKGCI